MPRVCVYPELWPKCMRVLQGTRSVGTVSNVLSVWHNQHLCSCLRVDSVCCVLSVVSSLLFWREILVSLQKEPVSKHSNQRDQSLERKQEGIQANSVNLLPK